MVWAVDLTYDGGVQVFALVLIWPGAVVLSAALKTPDVIFLLDCGREQSLVLWVMDDAPLYFPAIPEQCVRNGKSAALGLAVDSERFS